MSVYFSKRKKKRAWDRRSEAWNKRSTISTKNQMLEVIPEKREKGDGGYVYFVYVCVHVQTRYLCGGTLVPWYIVISVTLD